MAYLLLIGLSYLLGCSNMTFYLSKLQGVDMSRGSGNLGASNAVILMGWMSGVLVFLHDAGKAVVSVLIARFFFSQLPLAQAIAGVSCVLGHIFPFYLKFKGGKGFASYLGMTIALNWKLALVILAVVVIVTLITDYIVVGTVTTVVSVPVALGILEHSILPPLVLLVATGVILYKHRENYRRIFNGTEIGLRSASRGDHRK